MFIPETSTALFALLAAPAVAQPSAQPRDIYEFALPAQSLSVSLQAVGTRTGVTIVTATDLVDGVSAPALRGRYTARAAVDRLLAGTGLRSILTDDGIAVVAAAQANAAELDDPQEDVIIVTGTNVRGAVPTSPIQIISRRDIEASGSTSVEQLMRKVPQNSYAGVNKEMFGTVGTGVDVTDQGAGLNLRGLGQRATLVLLNGRRLAPTSGGAFVDVSLIPLGAIERVEILTDGASAIYGSDAVGGVVNFILRDDLKGLETLIQSGSATQGDGDQLRLAQSAGHGWSSGHAMLSYEYRREDEIRAGDRSAPIGLNPGLFLLPREEKHSLFAVGRQELAPGLTLDVSGSYSHRRTRWTYFLTGSSLPVDGDAKGEAFNIGGELSYAIGEDWRVRLETTYSRSNIVQSQVQSGGQALVNGRRARNEVREASLKFDGSLFELPGGAVRAAVGGLVRREDYWDDYATTAVPSFLREGDRTIHAAFAELLVPAVSALNRIDGIERLQFSLAGRYEHYSQFGSTFDPKIGMLWSPIADLSLRASWGTSFRAPLLSQAAGVYNAILFPAPILYLDPSEGQGVGLVLQGTNPNVGPETARNWTAGGEFSPRFLPGLTLSANYYAIRFTDRIARATSSVVVIGNPAFEPIVDRSPSVGEVQALLDGAAVRLDLSGPGFTNGNATAEEVTVVLENRISNTAVTTTSGVDVALDYEFAIHGSKFGLEVSATHILDFTDRFTATSPPARVLDTPYHALDWRLRAGLTWSRGGWSGNLAANHADDYRDDRGTFDNKVGSFTTLDFGLAYEFGRGAGAAWLNGLRIAFFGENILDQEPPLLLPDPGDTSGLGYDPVNASVRGRMLSLQLRKRW